MKLERVVVGVLPARASDGAVRVAQRLAGSLGAEFHAVHGAGSGGSSRFVRGLGTAREWASRVAAAEKRARDACRGRLEPLVDEPGLAERPLDELLSVRPESGARALLAHAEAEGADLIVLGGHRRAGLFDFGSTARSVLGGATCPVWIQPECQSQSRFSSGDSTPLLRRVVAAVDLSEASPRVLAAACGLARRLTLPLEVLHVFVPPAFAYDVEAGVPAGPTFVIDELRASERVALEALVESADGAGLELTVRQTEGDAVECIRARTKGDGTLLVMGTHGHGGLLSAVLGSVAYAALKGREGPTLVLPPAREPALEGA